MRFRFILSILIIFNILSCNNEVINEEVSTEIINLTKGLSAKGNNLYLSEFVTNIDYIFLETLEECMIDNIDKILIDDSLIFLYNKKQFFVFNIKGAFQNKIGNIGKGPGEYLRIMDFTLNPDSDKIFIFDSDQRKILTFNYRGDFINEFRINSDPTCITSLNNELILSWVKPDFIRNDNYGFSIYSEDGTLLKRFFKRNKEDVKKSTPSTFLTRLNFYCDTLTYWEINLDIIYRIMKDGTIIPRYKIDYATNKSSKNMNQIDPNLFMYSYIVEDENYLFFLRGVYKNKVKHLMYNKKNKELLNIEYNHNDLSLMLKAGFINDIDGGYPFLPFDALKDGRMYCTFFPYELKSLIEENIYHKIDIVEKQQQLQLYSTIQNAKAIDNPVIMLVKLK